MADLISREAVLEQETFLRDEDGFEYTCVLSSDIRHMPSVDAVSRGVYEQIKWERDVAMEQLEEHGIAFGAKKQGDAVEVVRCKDCKHKHAVSCEGIVLCSHRGKMIQMHSSDFCSYGERKEDNAR